ncbi:MAG: NAD-dependent epimerase/dehydratase family protein [Verrucomicrobia bacterium]|nr:NAD-dependent epimerase/dehydratase family protein [Verrucomicrobiota bacterium]MDA1065903.1 NAD-dependent epimerase/dehydratase family protein [Verrucomicrobiota bacterium]
MPIKTEKVLVTGGAGFIGSHVSRYLLNTGFSVVILDDLSGGFVENVPKGATFVKGSILDVQLLEELFQENQFDYVVHLAAYAAEGLSHFIKRFNYNNNLIGSVNLINESIKHDIKCFAFSSSIAVYGTNRLPMTEDLTPQPEDPYGIAKYAVELELKVSQEMFGLNYIIFRPHNVYGEFQHIGDKYRNVIGIFMNQIMKNEPITIFGDGLQTRAFSYVGNIAPFIAESVQKKDVYNEIFNIGSEDFISLNELATMVMNAMGKKVEIKRAEPRNEVKHAYCSHEKIKSFFGDRQEISMECGIKKMAEWAKNFGTRENSTFEAIELHKNMPSGWQD